MNPAPEVGLREAADELGVHYMTAYRYVRSGRLPAHKVGDEWRVRRGDLEAFRSGREVVPGVADSDVDGPAAGEDAAGGARSVFRSRLESRLIAGDEAGSWGMVEAVLASGAGPSDVLNEVLSPCLRSIGARWAAGELAIADEHRASAVATRLIARLGPRFCRPGRRRGTIVLGSISGDRHTLPTAIMGDLLRGAGFDVVDLGPDTPAESFIDTARLADRLVAVGVCVTAPEVLGSVPGAVRTLHAADLGAPVVVGGGAVPDEATARSVGADHWAAGADAVVALFERLAAVGV
jgi:MerR family transcriptional regulator, light-induced transcriptional regulator